MSVAVSTLFHRFRGDLIAISMALCDFKPLQIEIAAIPIFELGV